MKLNYKNIFIILVGVLVLGGCGANKDKAAQKTARFLFQETLEEECLKKVNKNKVVAFVLSNNQEDVQKICNCVSDEAFNHVTADEILKAGTDKEERKKIAAKVAPDTILVCAKKLKYIK